MKEQDVILKIDDLSKQYRLGLLGTGTISHDFNRWWAKIRGKEDPYLKIGETNDRSTAGDSDYVWALKNINFEVKQGEILGIIGKNGAGKSTLLKILSKVTTPTTGSVKSKGRIASLLEVGTGFHPEMTGRENIYLNGAILGMTKSEIRSKINEIIDFSGCERYIDTPVKRYSSGMRVRLGFAVAAFLEPDILVVDEVLAVGDSEFQKKAIGKMQDISKEGGRTVLFVSHNMGSIKNLCTNCVVLRNGEVAFKGETKEAIAYYFSNNSSEATESLIDRKDRNGNGKLLVKEVTFLDAKQNIVDEIISGDELNIKISLQKNKSVDYSKLIVGVSFNDGYENIILAYVSDEMGTNFTNLKNKESFYLKINNLNLRAGLYNIRIVLSEDGTQAENLMDVIDNCAKINVLEGDFWEIGKLNRKGHYAVMEGSFLIN